MKNTFDNLKLILDNIPSSVFIHDKNFKIIYANKAYIKNSKKPLNKILNRVYWSSFPRTRGALPGCLKALKTKREVSEIIEVDKNVFYQSRSVPILEGKKYKYSIHILIDTSDFQRLLARLKDEKETLRTIIEGATDAIFIHDKHGNFLRVNKAACKSLGYRRSELLNLSVFDIEVGAVIKKLNQVWKSAKIGKNIILDGVHKRKDGSEFPVEIHIGMVSIKNQEQLIAIVRDMSLMVLKNRLFGVKVMLSS